MADTLFSYPNLPLDLNMYIIYRWNSVLSQITPYRGNLGQHHLHANIYQQQHELRESFTQNQLFTTQMSIKS